MKTFEYKFVYDPANPKASSNGCVYEHVAVAEKMLGRPLNKDEVVHHIDGNKKNNNPENLMIFATSADHVSFHHGGQPWSNDGIIWHTGRKLMKKVCPACKKIFLSLSKDPRQKFCSVPCYLKFTYNIEEKIATAQRLLYENNGNFSAVARIFNVSSSGLAKLFKKHNLPYHSKDYKNKQAS